ncbi:MAG: response regulator [Ignavibacteriales bacterium]|nr:response regulator [Ignavibacteriales bacterium]
MNKKILIIEDEKKVRENISTLLTEESYTVISSKNGEEGIETAIKELPDLIICDIMMPGIDGYRVLEILSQNEFTKSIPFIFLTAKVERDDIRKGMLNGADDYLFKPFKADDLLKSIDIRLKRVQTLKGDFVNPKQTDSSTSLTNDDKIFVNVNSKPHLIKINEIIFISAESQYTSLKLVDGKTFLVRKSINSWDKLLPSKNFLRIHRSTIANLDFLIKMEKSYNSSFLIYLKHVAEPFVISKRYSTKIRQNIV